MASMQLRSALTTALCVTGAHVASREDVFFTVSRTSVQNQESA
jgi:hypothetical protein